MNIYYRPSTKQIYFVPNHYSHSLEYIKGVLKEAKNFGFIIPKDSDIKVEVLAGRRYKGTLSVEFIAENFPITNENDYIDLDKYPHMMDDLLKL